MKITVIGYNWIDEYSGCTNFRVVKDPTGTHTLFDCGSRHIDTILPFIKED